MSLLPVRRTLAQDPLIQWQDEVNRLLDEVWPERPWSSLMPLARWSRPALDLEEDSQHYYLHVDVPGVPAQGLTVQEVDGALVIDAKLESTEGRTSHVRERYVGRLHREIRLPRDANLDELSAGLHNGVLTITVPRRTEASGRTIPITAQ